MDRAAVQAMVRDETKRLDTLVRQLQEAVRAREFTTANRPSAGSVPAGTIIFVSDSANKFQGSDGSAWLNLS